jgi:cyclophilin family peptidyl-prolyl cis-trans isomerase
MPTSTQHRDAFRRRNSNRRRRRTFSVPVEPLENRQLFDVTVIGTPPATDGAGGSTETVDLSQYLGDPTQNTQVRITTSLGPIDLQLFDDTKPISVANFLNYLRTGRYNDTFIHRKTDASSEGIGVIQGGGYRNNPLAQHVTTDAPIHNEAPDDPVLSNTRGTIAMARTSEADSATSEWFINYADNTSLDPSQQPPGYAVFGNVINDTLSTVDAIAALPVFNFGQAFSTLPLRNYTQDDYQPPGGGSAKTPTVADNLVTVSAETLPELTFSVTSSNPAVVMPVVSGNTLTLQYVSEGTADITITGTDSASNSNSVTFQASTKTSVNIGGAGNPTSVTFADADGSVNTVSIKGAGTATVTFNGANLTTTPNGKNVAVSGAVDSIASVALTGGSAATAVTLTTKGGDNAVTVAGITADSALKSFSAKTTNLTGAMTITGAVGKVDLGSINNGSVTIGGAATDKPVTMTVAGAVTTSDITSAPPINSITAGSYVSSTDKVGGINAPAIGKLTSKGAFSQDVTVSGPIKSFSAGGDVTGVVVNADSFGSITVKGNVSNGQFDSSQAFAPTGKPMGKVNISGDVANTLIRATGNIASVSVASITGSTIFAGIAGSLDLRTLPTQATDFASPASIGTVTIKGGFSDSRVAAVKLNKVAVGIVTTANNGTVFGVAGDTIGSVTGTLDTTKFTLKKLATQDDVTRQTNGLTLSDFAVTVVEPPAST